MRRWVLDTWFLCLPLATLAVLSCGSDGTPESPSGSDATATSSSGVTATSGSGVTATSSSGSGGAGGQGAGPGGAGGSGGAGAQGGAGGTGGGVVFTASEIAVIQTLSPLPNVPPDPTNAYADNPQAAALGQRFFFDKGYSGPLAVGDDGMNGGLGAMGESGKVSCASCHLPDWFIDTRSNPNNVSLGANWGRRNATSIVNAAFYTWFNEDGGNDSIWASMQTSEGGGSVNSTRLAIAHHIYNKYKDEYNAIFSPPLDPALDPNAPDAARFPPSGKPKASAMDPDGPWEMMAPADQIIINRIWVNFGKAMGAYQRLLVSRNAPFDQFVAGNDAAIDDAAKRGLKLFIGPAGCIQCHSGPSFSDNAFHNLGVPQVGLHVPTMDLGRFSAIPRVLNNPFNSNGMYSDDPNTGKLNGLMQTAADTGAFRTSTLRQIAQTAPHMHTGGFPTLADVIEFYDAGGGTMGFDGTKDPLMQPLGLTPQQKADLVAFLQTLTGEPIPAALKQDTSAP